MILINLRSQGLQVHHQNHPKNQSHRSPLLPQNHENLVDIMI